MTAPAQPAGAAGRADSPALATKRLACQFKALGDDGGEFELYAAAYGVVDRQGDLIEPNAVVNLAELIADGVVLWEHGLDKLPVGWIVTATQDAAGLRVIGRWHSTPHAQACRTTVLERLAAGKSVKCSVGYVPVSAVPDSFNGRQVRRLRQIRAYEASFVNLPANPLAEVISAKSADAGPTAHSQPDAPSDPAEPDPGAVDRLRLLKLRASHRAANPV